MRRLSLFLLVLLLPASLAFAQTGPIDKGMVEISGFGGGSIPLPDISDIATTGFGVGGSLGYYVNPRSSIGGSIVFNSFGVDEAFDEPGVDVDIQFTEFTGYWKVLFGQGPSVMPYGRIVGGLFRAKVGASAGGLDVSVTNTDFGFGAGFGLQFMGQGSVGGSVEFLLLSDFTEGSTSNYLGIRGGVNFFTGGGGA